MAPGHVQGAIFVSALAFVTVALDDHPFVMVPVVMPIMVMAVLDHNGLSVGNGRCGDCNLTDRSDDVSKLLHVVLLV